MEKANMVVCECVNGIGEIWSKNIIKQSQACEMKYCLADGILQSEINETIHFKGSQYSPQ